MNRALLVGINAYPDAPLRGCVNDVTDMANFLVARRGFAQADIRLLSDRRATTAVSIGLKRFESRMAPDQTITTANRKLLDLLNETCPRMDVESGIKNDRIPVWPPLPTNKN
ncbi:MAG: caspase family protein [Verrucomicrobiota bacterium]